METHWILLAVWIAGVFVTANLLYDFCDFLDDQIKSLASLLILSLLWPFLMLPFLLVVPLFPLWVITYPARLWRRRRAKVVSTNDGSV